MNQGTDWIYEFDYLRTIAILSVLIAHGYGVFGGATLFNSLNSYMTFLGAIGVILFFFISGFLISKHTPENVNSLLILIKERILRIGPLYWSALFLTSFLYSLNIYQGFWIKDFNFYNVVINSFFLSNFVPSSDIPPFWFVSSLVLFSVVYFILRYLNKNPFYFSLSSLAVFFLFLTFEMKGITWATNTFIYFIFGTLLGMQYYAHMFNLGKITSVPAIISIISKSSYPVFLFHLVFFGLLLKLLNFLHITNFFIQICFSITVTIFLGHITQYIFESFSKKLFSR